MADSPDAPVADEAVGRRTFSTSFRGFDQGEVRAYLEVLAVEFATLKDRIAELETELNARPEVVAPSMDIATLTAALGEETAKVLRTAQEAAEELRTRAEEGAARTLKEAHDEGSKLRQSAETVLAERTAEAEEAAARIRNEAAEAAERVRSEATAEKDAVIARAVAEGRDMVGQAQAARERVLADLARRRNAALTQLEALRAGRERLLESFTAAQAHTNRILEDLERSDEEAREAAEMVGRSTAKAAARQAAAESAVEAPQPQAGPEADAAPAVEQEEAEPATVRDTAATAPEAATAPDAASHTEAAIEPESAAGPKPAAAPEPAAESKPAETEPTAEPEPAPVVEAEAASVDPGPALAPAPEPAPVVEAAPVDRAPAPEPDRAPATDRAPEPHRGPAPDPVATTVPEAVAAEVAAADLATPRPEPEPTGQPEPARPAYAHDAVPAAVFTGPAVGEPAEPTGRVDQLFARIRADRAVAVDQARTVLATEEPPAPAAPPTVEDNSLEAPRTDADEIYLQQRDVLVEVATAGTTKTLKRELADDQNAILERLRTASGGDPDSILEKEEHQLRAWSKRATPGLIDGAAAGARLGGGSQDPAAVDAVAAIADRLAAELVLPLRQRVVNVLEAAAGESGSQTSDHINSVFREWRGRVDRAVADSMVEAVSLGFLAAVEAGTKVRWVVEDADGPCPDCDDNALAGPWSLGEPFPTGQHAPPAHPGCRCVLARTTT